MLSFASPGLKGHIPFKNGEIKVLLGRGPENEGTLHRSQATVEDSSLLLHHALSGKALCRRRGPGAFLWYAGGCLHLAGKQSGASTGVRLKLQPVTTQNCLAQAAREVSHWFHVFQRTWDYLSWSYCVRHILPIAPYVLPNLRGVSYPAWADPYFFDLALIAMPPHQPRTLNF